MKYNCTLNQIKLKLCQCNNNDPLKSMILCLQPEYMMSTVAAYMQNIDIFASYFSTKKT